MSLNFPISSTFAMMLRQHMGKWGGGTFESVEECRTCPAVMCLAPNLLGEMFI